VAQAVGSLLEYERGDTTAIEQSILDHVASQLPPGRPIAAVRGKRRTIAFVGPTGVGKTTTIAKLATTFQLELGVSTGLISVDPYRFAAAEQIRAYGEAIGTPVATVSNQDELSGALRSLGGVELVLVDTAGCPPKNRARLEEIAASLEILAPDEIHLVFAVNSSRHHLCESRSAFLSRVPLNRVLLTKMDEAGCMLSHLLEVLRGTDSPLSYWTTGQIVPDDIEPATPDRLARLMLAKERIDEAE
jgi:flagellar biosynthesis protein FlhF